MQKKMREILHRLSNLWERFYNAESYVDWETLDRINLEEFKRSQTRELYEISPEAFWDRID